MHIELQKVGKKFNTEWIFKDLSFTFEARSATAILGRNGSGKSTLLQLIAGNLHPTAGTIHYTLNGKPVPAEQVFRHLTLVAPYLELIEEFTLREMLEFHFRFKPILPGFTLNSLTDMLGFRVPATKPIQQFSSGMKQRIKLLIAFMSDIPLLLLDEPTMNLDQAGIDWYHRLIADYTLSRTVIICTNQHQTESGFATRQLQVEDYKIQVFTDRNPVSVPG